MKKTSIIVILLIAFFTSSHSAKAWWVGVGSGFQSYPVTGYTYPAYTPSYTYSPPVYYSPWLTSPVSSFGFSSFGNPVISGLRETGFMLSRPNYLNYSGYFPTWGFGGYCSTYCY